uniref:Farnesoic acid O-methyl transferase domain-containing protein n=1 Tax=Megaselia scalaris TaxID=36166 RepID=T1GH20_MEGSC
MFFAVVLIAFISLSNAGHLDDCKVGQKFNNVNMVQFKISDFQNNAPKDTEVLRTKLYYKYPNPVFSMYNSGKQITFGDFRNDSSFAIFKSHHDYIGDKNECDSVIDVNIFNNTKFIGVVFTLEKNGLFSVIINDDIVLSCETGFNFDFSKDHDIYITYRGTKVQKFLYDCPIC